MKLEVGKTYVDAEGRKWTILSKHGWIYLAHPTGMSEGITRAFRDTGEVFFIKGKTDFRDFSKFSFEHLVKEWKEPIVHRRDIVWYKNGLGGVYVDTYLEGQTFGDHIKVLKRETVEYTEE